MEERQTLEQATKLWQEAYRYQTEGELERAIERYQRSIQAHPMAEAHTFLGWALSFQGRLEEATTECLRAIEIDPEFGNPYNDIGVYLMQRDKLDESIPWLEKAKRAKRYEPRQFPFMNLGTFTSGNGAGGRPSMSSKGPCGWHRGTATRRRCFMACVRG